MYQLEPHVADFLVCAHSKALATMSAQNELNVVPVSSLFIEDGTIVLVNYFMEKTVENILQANHVALVAWSEMIGYQVKGTVTYHVSGSLFEKITLIIKQKIPDRTVKGILIIAPSEVYDIAPDKKTHEHMKNHL